MCNWKNWIWPGIVTTACLTALIGWFWTSTIHEDLGLRAGDQLHAAQPWAKIEFKGRDGVLSGIAENGVQQREAGSIALSTYGVRKIDNQSKLPPKVDPFVFSIVKKGDGVLLKGNYADTESRLAIVAAAETAMPGIAIKHELTLASGKPNGFDVLAAFGIDQIADMTSGEVSLANLSYSIKGMPADLSAYEKLSAATAALPAGGILIESVLALPVLDKPYEFSAVFDGSTLNLSGYAPSAKLKSAIEAKAKEFFTGKAVNTNIKLAQGAPDQFWEAVVFGLAQISGLDDSSFSLSDLKYEVKGKAADAASYDVKLRMAKNHLPAGMTLTAADITAPDRTATTQKPMLPVQSIFAPTPEAKACEDRIGAILKSGQINFEVSQAVITQGSFEVLAKIAAALNGCESAKMEIGGHTDTDGDDASNETLSQVRANAVRDMLLKAGVNGMNILAKGYGETRPLVPNDTDENKAKNRRLEFRLVP